MRVDRSRRSAIIVDPTPMFEISPWLYMQFMEPLGVTDGSVEACWDYDRDDWREDFIQTVRDLSPGAIRFGGLFSRYYKWREGIGPAAKRPPMRNYAGADGKAIASARMSSSTFVAGSAPIPSSASTSSVMERDASPRGLATPEKRRNGWNTRK